MTPNQTEIARRDILVLVPTETYIATGLVFLFTLNVRYGNYCDNYTVLKTPKM